MQIWAEEENTKRNTLKSEKYSLKYRLNVGFVSTFTFSLSEFFTKFKIASQNAKCEAPIRTLPLFVCDTSMNNVHESFHSICRDIKTNCEKVFIMLILLLRYLMS